MTESAKAAVPLVVAIGFRLEPALVERLRQRFPTVDFRVSASKRHLLEIVAGAQVFFGWPNDDILAAGQGLRWLHLLGAGADGFSLGAAKERSLQVTNARGVAAPNIAEHTLGLMIGFCRSFHVLARAQRDRRWLKPQDLAATELADATLGIVGLGAIGEALAVRARAMGMRVLGVRRSIQPTPYVDQLFSLEHLGDMAAQSDHLVVCTPQTPASIGLIDRRILQRMRPSAYLYNLGRGSAIVTADLLDALERNVIAGAGLDVTDPEPLPPEHPLWAHPNVVITCHTSGNSNRYWERGIVTFEHNLEAYLQNRPLTNVVDLEQGY
ncbi:MAG: D-2-hydroxyacid dehydrogenase [Burkholderiaceae bacterium]